MKRYTIWIMYSFLIVGAIVWLLTVGVRGLAATPRQLYWQVQEFDISTTHLDTTWSTPWVTATIVVDTVDCWVKFGAPDTTSWDDDDWGPLFIGMSYGFESDTPLRRMEIYTVSGTGKCWVMGTRWLPGN